MYMPSIYNRMYDLENNEINKLFRKQYSLFDHNGIYKESWIAPNGLTKNLIDYMLIKKNSAKRITNARTIIITKINQEGPSRIKQTRKEWRKFDTRKLKDITIAKHFQKEIARNEKHIQNKYK